MTDNPYVHFLTANAENHAHRESVPKEMALLCEGINIFFNKYQMPCKTYAYMAIRSKLGSFIYSIFLNTAERTLLLLEVEVDIDGSQILFKDDSNSRARRIADIKMLRKELLEFIDKQSVLSLFLTLKHRE